MSAIFLGMWNVGSLGSRVMSDLRVMRAADRDLTIKCCDASSALLDFPHLRARQELTRHIVAQGMNEVLKQTQDEQKQKNEAKQTRTALLGTGTHT